MPSHARIDRPVTALLTALLLAALSADARAHFLFVRIGPVAEGGRSAEVYFSEQARAGDPRFIPKIAHTKLWIQTTPGEFRELKVQAGADRLRSILPSAASLAVVGECRYGVLSRPKQPPFLLRHYPKAIAGDSAEVNRLTRRAETPFEIVATVEPKIAADSAARVQGAAARIRLVALRDGKPMPGVQFHSVASDLTEVKFLAGTDGSATWEPPRADQYCFYVADTRKESGELDGKKYEEVRDFATLTLDWPLGPRSADPVATALFRKAIARRAQWIDFPGFSASIQGDLDGRAFDGKVTVTASGKVELEVDDEAAIPWLQDQLDSLVMHRLPAQVPARPSADPSKDPGLGFTLRFGDSSEDHPLGRLLLVNGGRMASSYRIKDDQIRVVNRNLGRQSMTLHVLTLEENPRGLVLPRQYVVNYWDSLTGRLDRTETIQDQWFRAGLWDLPASHAVSTASDGGMSTRTVTLKGHTLLGKP